MVRRFLKALLLISIFALKESGVLQVAGANEMGEAGVGDTTQRRSYERVLQDDEIRFNSCCIKLKKLTQREKISKKKE